jgi:fibronectin type 3 domain-containing protein
VKLAWEAPASSSVPVAGYDVLRAQSGGSNYALLNSTPQTATTYVDSTVKAGITYDYVIESVSSSGTVSSPSSVIAVTIP